MGKGSVNDACLRRILISACARLGVPIRAWLAHLRSQEDGLTWRSWSPQPFYVPVSASPAVRLPSAARRRCPVRGDTPMARPRSAPLMPGRADSTASAAASLSAFGRRP